MKIFYNDKNIQLSDKAISALSILRDSGLRRQGYHFLKGYASLSSLTIPDTHNKGRIILKNHGNNRYEIVLLDHGHKYDKDKLRNLDALSFEDELKELKVESLDAINAELEEYKDNDIDHAYHLRGKIIVPKSNQIDIVKTISDFITEQMIQKSKNSKESRLREYQVREKQ